MLLKVLLLIFCVVVSGLDDEEYCEKNGEIGTCVNLSRCLSAQNELKNGKRPQICSYVGRDSIVCCFDGSKQSTSGIQRQNPAATTTTRPTRITEDYDSSYEYEDDDTCPPVPSNWTTSKTGSKAWNKCIDYQEQFVYPCEVGVTMDAKKTRPNKCLHKADQLIVGGTAAELHEFPHMVLIGYGEKSGVQWMSGGSIISENFILTAAHCAYANKMAASYVAVSVLTRLDASNDTNVYKIKRIVRHPNYSPLKKYHDIALLETEIPIRLNQYTVPACLDTGAAARDDRASATGWGSTAHRGSASNVLQKVILNQFTAQECSRYYPVNRRMPQGFDPNTQICYGHKTEAKDTCQGDSGGPMQIKSQEINCMYVIVGVTSFGGACGFAGEAGIYTRVQYYLPWVESVVWPDA